MIVTLGELNYIKGVLAAAKPYADAHTTDPLHSDYENRDNRTTHVEASLKKYQSLLTILNQYML